MSKTTWGMLFLLLALMTGMSSCLKSRYITVNPTEQTFSYQGGNGVLHILSNCRWTVEKDPDATWLTIGQTSGKNDGTISFAVERNTLHQSRSTILRVVSSNGKTQTDVIISQTRPDITAITRKIWFTNYYERWDLDYYNQVIEDSYRSFNYDLLDPESSNWFFYFLDDSTGYQVNSYKFDTVNYQFDYIFYPERDSLYIHFLTEADVVEDYHVTVHELNTTHFVFGDEYVTHRFEKIYTTNISGTRNQFYINPKKTAKKKPTGSLIPMKR